ncbi:GEVED domain-containing protein [Actibacterium sp. D379-3]
MAIFPKQQHFRAGRNRTGAAAVLLALTATSAVAQTCSVSPDFVDWVTPGTLGITGDQTGTLQWGSASATVTISGPQFVVGTETSIIRFNEDPGGRGTFSVAFDAPVVHDINVFFGNLGRTTADALGSGIVGDFGIDTSDGGSLANVGVTLSPLDNAGYFQTFVSDTQGFALTTLSGPGPDGLPLDGRTWIHDAVLDFGNGGADQAYGMVDLAYDAPVAITPASATIDAFSFRQIGDGVGPTGALGIQARMRSCITAATDDLSATPVAGDTGGTTASVLGNDMLNGAGVATGLAGNVTLAVVTGAAPATGAVTLNTDTGEIEVTAGTAAGTYTIEYAITDRPVGGVASNTDTALATVVVTAPAAAVISADDDDFSATPINGFLGGTAGDAFDGDTLDGGQVEAGAVTATVLSPATPATSGAAVPELVLSGVNEGFVNVPAPTPAGLYTIQYQLCEDANPGNCDVATITVTVLNGLGLDYGDAPISYLAPAHNVPTVPTVFLGSVAPDTEPFEQPGAAATGDDLADVDDEDGVTFPVLTQGTLTTMTAAVTGPGLLQGWIDFNGDGVFEDVLGERIATDLADDGTGADTLAGDGAIQFVVDVPTDAVTTTTYARFRFSSTAGLDAQLFAADGEVEDYALIIAAADLVDRGDAPASYGAPRHIVVPLIYLGAGRPDTELAPQGNAAANGDDLAGIDDEDGIAILPTFVAGTTTSVTVQTHETLSLQLELPLPPIGLVGITNLQMWIDFDGDGVFSPAEQVAADYRDGGTGDTDGTFNNSISFDVAVPSNAPSQTTFARLRWSTTSGLAPNAFDGLNLDGEVEDYLVTIVNNSPPLTCDSSFYMIANETAQNLPALTRLEVTANGTGYDLSQTLLPPDYTGNYLVTGWGYNELDGYIYGVGQSPRTLWRIDATGAVTEAADLSALGLEAPDTATDILPNGILIYKSGTSNSVYQLLDLSDPANPVNAGVLNVGGGAPYGRDMAYNSRDGLIYFFDSSRDLYAFDPNNGVAGATTATLIKAQVPLPAGYFAMDIDSVWFDQQGYIYGFDNQSRQVFALEVGVDGNRPATWDFIEINGTVANLTYQGNDGASCRGPGPFAPALPTGGSLSGNVYVDANASDSRDAGEANLGAGIAIALYDDKGTPGDLTDDTFLATTDTASGGTYAFTDLSDALTYRIQIDTADPDLPAGSAIGTSNPLLGVAVVDGADTGNQDFGFDPQQSDLSITKTALSAATGQPVTTAAEGDVIDWVITVTNAGPGSPAGVRVMERLPSGFQYISDDAPATGDTYDPDTGIWVVDEILSGASETLTIRTSVLGAGDRTNTAEIIASSLQDTDSDPGVGPRTDDLGDGAADDDEASYTVTLETGQRLLEGRVFIDNGTGGGTAHDAALNGGEGGTQNASLTLLDGAGGVLASPRILADGSWRYALAAGYSGPLTVMVVPDGDHLTISEANTGLPGLSNSDPHDGAFTFTPEAGAGYAGLDFGLIRAATLTQDQTSGIEAGQVAMLAHDYTAHSAGTVTFGIEDEVQTPAGAFAATIYLDGDCDGTPDSAITAPIAVAADTRLCLISRVTANSGIGSGSSFSYALVATTAYSGTSAVARTSNTDRLISGAGNGRLELTKTVRNQTQNTPEGASNAGAVGDVLQYRIYLTNPGSVPASNVIIYDKTPAYTALAAAIPSPVALGSDLTCTVAQPVSNAAGYAGALRWDCTGSYAPGDTGSVSFQVRISP